jgi:antitoxin HigA-1
MNAVHGIRVKNPAHPGGFVKSEIIETLGLSVRNAAKVLGVTRAASSTVLNEHAHLSPKSALRIEKTFGMSIDTLMQMQNSYDTAQARKRDVEIKAAPFKGTPLDPQ